MSIAATAVFAGVTTKTWNVVASSDGDTAGTITHGFGAAPALVFFTPLLVIAYTSLWVITSISASEIILGKTSAGTSSSTAAQVRVTALLPHTLIG